MQDLSTHGVVALIRNNEGKYLFLEDAQGEMEGHWAPPHGCCENSDDSEENGVIREVLEETNLTVTPIKKIHTQPADTRVKTVSFWIATAKEYDVTLDYESSAYEWLTPEEALGLRLYPGTKSFFEKVQRHEITL